MREYIRSRPFRQAYVCTHVCWYEGAEGEGGYSCDAPLSLSSVCSGDTFSPSDSTDLFPTATSRCKQSYIRLIQLTSYAFSIFSFAERRMRQPLPSASVTHRIAACQDEKTLNVST